MFPNIIHRKKIINILFNFYHNFFILMKILSPYFVCNFYLTFKRNKLTKNKICTLFYHIKLKC